VTGEQRRGSYPKGIAKREEILQRALDVIAREGYRGASVKELADAAGLSQAGLLHYFVSKEELFTEIVRSRDQVEFDRYGSIDPEIALDDLKAGYLGVMEHNLEVPGLIELFARLAVDAAADDHPAHDYYLRRSAWLREGLSAAIARLQDSGAITAGVDPDILARIFQALADGLQVQWIQDRDIDMSAIVDGFFAAISPPSRS